MQKEPAFPERRVAPNPFTQTSDLAVIENQSKIQIMDKKAGS